jgi:hypothetical protein
VDRPTCWHQIVSEKDDAMNFMEMAKRLEPNVRSRTKPDLRVERRDITFHDLGEGRVRVQVRVHNAGAHRSLPTPMELQSAPLGAFVPWQPLARLLVPALESGESRVLSTEVTRPNPAPLGGFNRVPPKRLLTAVNSPDLPQPSPQPSTGVMAWLNHFRTLQRARLPGREPARGPFLAPDLWDLLDRGQPHWAGNINVFIGEHAVERHLAQALRVYPERTNLAAFMVGGPGKRDAYTFELVGLGPEWEAALYILMHEGKPLVDSMHEPIEDKRWVVSDGGLVVMLATRPPAGCRTGNLEVHVTQRSCLSEAIVEFDLDAGALGTGCYCV